MHTNATIFLFKGFVYVNKFCCLVDNSKHKFCEKINQKRLFYEWF